MAEEVSRELINTLIFEDCIGSETNLFDLRENLFYFRKDCDSSLTETKALPILKDEFSYNRRGLDIDLDIDLREGMPPEVEQKRNFKNYGNNITTLLLRRERWIPFLRSLQENKTIEKEVPTFVVMSDTISEFFGAEEWDSKFFALKFNGVIYLYANESLPVVERVEERAEERINSHNNYLQNFKHLVSHRNQSEGKCWSVDRIHQKNNKLILCSGIAAQHRNGSSVYVKCRQIHWKYMTDEYKHRLLRNWSSCVVNGSKTLIIGRRFRSRLEEVIVRQVDKIPDECRNYWSDSKCLSFVDQSLDFIKSCVGSEIELYEFEINSKNKTLSCFRRQSADTCDHFLPEFYTKS